MDKHSYINKRLVHNTFHLLAVFTHTMRSKICTLVQKLLQCRKSLFQPHLLIVSDIYDAKVQLHVFIILKHVWIILSSEHCYITYTAQKASIHQETTMIFISKNVLFPDHNYLITTSTDDPSLAGAWAIIKVSGHQYQWLAGGYDLEKDIFRGG